MPPIIEVNNLGKKYNIGERQNYVALRDVLTNITKAPLHWLRRKRGNTKKGVENEFWALKDISFNVEKGEVVGIIGRNGAGKSTLLKILSRITPPTTGEIRLRGRVVSLLEVGTGFHPELTGRENIFLNGAILGMKKKEIERKFDDMVEFAGIGNFLDTPVKRYSSGMHVRLAFSVAAHLEPDILVVDEVLAVGDAEFQKKCLGKMKDVTKTQGRTVLFVSHNMTAIQNLCNRTILLEDGMIKEIGPTNKVIHTYLHNLDQENNSQWKNPGNLFDNKWCTPLEMSVVDAHGKAKKVPLRNDDDDIWLRMLVNVEELDPALNISYHVYNEENALVYMSMNTDQKQEQWPTLVKGENVLLTKIPAHFLNEGRYTIMMEAGLIHRQYLFGVIGNGAPNVGLWIEGGLSDSPYWLKKREGVTAPVIPWKLVT